MTSGDDTIRAVWDEARELIKRLEGTTVQRIALEAGGTRIEIEREVGEVAPAAPAPVAQAAGEEGPAEYDGRHAVTAPLVGTFYRAPQPGADPFVKEGDAVDPAQTVAIVEAMKLMNQVPAGISGRVAEIVVEDGQWVEFEQVLMFIEPQDS
jgi:acetyl-CoA carboxylase biotin carboxyl carrier protein